MTAQSLKPIMQNQSGSSAGYPSTTGNPSGGGRDNGPRK